MKASFQQYGVRKIHLFIQYVLSLKFAVHIILVIICCGGLLYGTLSYLDYYTHHGEEISVPELVGMHRDDLTEFLQSRSLDYLIIDSVYKPDEEKGIVVAQNPKPMSKVKVDRTIYITVNAINPPTVKLPIVADKSLRQAISILQNSGLVIGELQYIPDQCTNCVLGQKIFGYTQVNDTIVPKGTVVDLILGGGLSDEKILVPLLVNLTREEAIAKLKSAFLNLGGEIYDNSVFDDEDSVNARIFAQNPPYNEYSWVHLGSSVDVEFTMLKNKIDSNVVLDSSILSIYQFEKDTL
ncbi:MAG: PASTA domain-containing protein [Vicingaceae bacterium]